MRTTATLAEAYQAVVCDLDGVVRRGTRAVAHAVDALTALGVPVVYATNNASLTPADVAAQLVGLGLAVSADDVVTSSQAGAAFLGERLAPGSVVLAVGGRGVADALCEVHLTVAESASDGELVAVLQGYGPLVTATDLAEAAYAVQAGALWVATNADRTLPTHRGVAPGNGALVEAVSFATGTRPVAVGKPAPALYDLSMARLGCGREDTLAIGDRLDTDILGAMAAGVDSLWVLTGVDDLRSFARAPDRPLPTYASVDLRALSLPPQVAVKDGSAWSCNGVAVTVDPVTGTVVITGRSGPASDVVERDSVLACAFRALAEARDGSGSSPAGLDALDRAAAALTSELA
ncbi:MAG: HAD-IIA family hydrolase [Actinomycetota bacterium]|nr:HAD-IIA family hydrolase [Actinomycetota bacterium]